jgi:hypothetical protein
MYVAYACSYAAGRKLLEPGVILRTRYVALVSIRHTQGKSASVFCSPVDDFLQDEILRFCRSGSLSKIAHIQNVGGQLQETAALIFPVSTARASCQACGFGRCHRRH